MSLVEEMHQSYLRSIQQPLPLHVQMQQHYESSISVAAAGVHSDPSEAQKKAGNYKKGHFSWKGLDITIEIAKGQVRKGVSKAGVQWANKMQQHYGYIKRSLSADGDNFDLFIGTDLESEIVFVVDQLKADGKFDECKGLIGFTNAREARQAYLSNYPADWKGFGGIRALTLSAFKEWIENGDTGKPIEGQKFDYQEICEEALGATIPETPRGISKTVLRDDRGLIVRIIEDRGDAIVVKEIVRDANGLLQNIIERTES